MTIVQMKVLALILILWVFIYVGIRGQKRHGAEKLCSKLSSELISAPLTMKDDDILKKFEYGVKTGDHVSETKVISTFVKLRF